MSETIRVEVFSDIACPWCYIGKRRFQDGVEAFRSRRPEAQVQIESKSFELAPDTPVEFSGSEVDFLTRHKGMPRQQVEQMLEQMTQMAAAEGLEFHFDRVQHVNTRRAHRVLHLAKAHGLQAELMDRLFQAYFTEGRNVADPDTLAELGEQVGLDPEQVRAAYDDDALGQAVSQDIERARALGVNGVPFWVIEGRYGISGAQPAEQVAQALEQIWAEREAGERS